MRLLRIIFPSIAFLAFFAGVMRDDVPEEEYLKLAQQSQFDCVGQVYYNNNPTASCVLVGSRFVLSATHIFIKSDFRPDTMKMNGQTVIANTPYNQRLDSIANYTFVFKDRVYRGRSLNCYPGYLDSTSKTHCDIAVIELAEEVKGITPSPMNTQFNELHSNVVGVGYGASGIAGKPQSVKFEHKKIAGENVVDELSGSLINNYPSVMQCDFDHPKDKRFNQMGSASPQHLEYIGAGGDSGGGLFRNTDQGWELIGIYNSTSYDITLMAQSGYYGQVMSWTRVSVLVDWINHMTSGT